MKTALLVLALCTLPLAAEEVPSITAMATAAEEFLAKLDGEKRQKAALPFEAEDRENFRYTPRARTGLPLDQMDGAQKAAAMKLLEAALSERGKLKATQIITLEGILAEMEKNPTYRDSGKYYVSIFGKPGDPAAWGWKFEGHHLSLNFTVTGGKEVTATPSFMGSNPAEVRSGEHKGMRVLADEENLARALTLALLAEGHKEVIFSEKAPAEILTGESRKATVLEPAGLPASAMTEEQKKGLRELVTVYTGRNRKDLSDADLAKIDKAGFEKVRFGWAGSTRPGEAYYYRIQGPTFLMECANTQNDANHIHATWRDFSNDFGRDYLGQHYHHHQKEGAKK